MNTERDSLEILTQALNQLKIQHSETEAIIKRIELGLDFLKEERSSSKSRKAKTRKEYRVSKEDCEDLIGESVRIVNPGKGESDLGYIHSVGKVFVNINIEGGTRKQRIAKNIRLIRYE